MIVQRRCSILRSWRIKKTIEESIKLEVENEEFFIHLIKKNPLTLLQLVLEFGKKGEFKSSLDGIFTVLGALYVTKNYESKYHDLALKLADLSLDNNEKKDAIIETLYIMASPDREKKLQTAIKEKGRAFKSPTLWSKIYILVD